ncbi:hypothetical protein J437_LFUL009987 [Ladona fulva]|uniref:DDE Tnp4 domain-containing protein n=1 Tax=Ladona fulva TaxID=123851 RepID=A0A8K0KM38_LADFU|nr:hypothetical protein J437_LFUL009987 [Ladona fulva]
MFSVFEMLSIESVMWMPIGKVPSMISWWKTRGDVYRLSARTPNEQQYNSSHIGSRNTIERCFGVLKRRFPCLSHGLRLRLETTVTVIVAFVLHKIALSDSNRIEDNAVELEDEEQPDHAYDIEEDLQEVAARTESVWFIFAFAARWRQRLLARGSGQLYRLVLMLFFVLLLRRRTNEYFDFPPSNRDGQRQGPSSFFIYGDRLPPSEVPALHWELQENTVEWWWVVSAGSTQDLLCVPPQILATQPNIVVNI